MINNKNTQTIKSAIDQLFKVMGYDKKIAYAKIKKNLHKIIDPKFIPYILDITFIDQKIYIKVSSPIIRNELNFYEQQILNKCNQIAEKNIIQKVIIY